MGLPACGGEVPDAGGTKEADGPYAWWGERPFDTIQEAIDASKEGGTVRVDAEVAEGACLTVATGGGVEPRLESLDSDWPGRGEPPDVWIEGVGGWTYGASAILTCDLDGCRE